MSFIYLIIFGALVGWIASMILKTNDTQGLLGDILLGILGAVVGGWIMDYFGQPGVTGFNIYSILVAVIGALVFIAAARLLLKLFR